jgi:type I restriction enzyme, S subunit
MNRKWRSCLLKDVVERFIDYRGKTPRKTSIGVPLITAKIVKKGFIQPAAEFIAEADYDVWMTRGLPERGDVVMTTEAPLGEVAQIRTGSPVALAQRIITLRGRRGVLDNTYLKFALQGPVMQARLYTMASGTTVIGIKGSELQKLSIEVPEYPKQCAIAETLGSFDDKIDCNRRINDLLLKMARALFQHWFVDFGPFKKRGLQDSDIGPIPKGWCVTRLADLTSKIGSGATPRGGSMVYVEEGVAFIRSQNVYDHEFHWDGLVRLKDQSADELRGVTVQRDDVLFNITGDSIMRTCVVDPAVLPARVNQHVAIIRALESIPPRFLHLYLVQSRMKKFMLGFDAGATRKAITKGQLEALPVLHPPAEVLTKFREATDEWFTLMEKNQAESRLLAQTRDYLLPKLLSGEVEVGEGAGVA